MYRTLISEALRFPSLIEQQRALVMEPFCDVLRRLLAAAIRAGQLRADCDVEETLRAVIGLTTGWLTQQRLLGHSALQAGAERERFFKVAWTLFLRGASGT